MNYIEKVLGIKVKYSNESTSDAPIFLNSRYSLKVVYLDHIKTIFLYPLCDLNSAKSIRKHMDLIERLNDCHAVLILDNLSFRQKESYIKERIPFVSENKAIYLPFIGMYLGSKYNSEKNGVSQIYPATQLLLLYFIYCGCKNLSNKEAADELGVSLMSISRAVNQLKELNIIDIKKDGNKASIYTNKTPKELFEFSENYLLNPVKRKIYLWSINPKEGLYISGYSALAEYSNISAPNEIAYASEEISKYAKKSSTHRYSDEIEIEYWRYDPKKLADDGVVDPLSLYLSLKDDPDERVQGALEEMLNALWEKLDGKRI